MEFRPECEFPKLNAAHIFVVSLSEAKECVVQRSRVVIALLVPLALSSIHADARSFTGRRGNTTSWQGSRSGNTVSGSVTGPGGRTVSGTASEYNAGGAVHGYSGAVTGPNGTTVKGAGLYAPGYGGAVEIPGHGGAVVAPGNGAAVWHQPPQ